MISKFFYTASFLILLPVSLLLIFKPQAWQIFYSRIYSYYFKSEESTILKTLAGSLLAMISTEAGKLAHRAIGIFLGLVTIYIFFAKLKIISAF